MTRHLILAALIPCLAGCWPWILEADPREGGGGDTSDTDDTPLPPVTIGPEGGTFTFGDLTLVVPPNATASPVTLTITETSRVAPAPWVQMSPIWALTPVGASFDPPATLTVPYTPGGTVYAATPGDGPGGYRPTTPLTVGSATVDVSINLVPTELFIGDPTVGFEVFPYTTASADLLFVIDDSCSMSQLQSTLATSLPAFLQLLDNTSLEWRAGVVTTDVERTGSGTRGRLRELNGQRWVNWDDPDPMASMTARVNVGINGSPTEQGLAATFAAVAVERDGWNAGFFRDDAHTAVYILSDEEDYSPLNGLTLAEFADGFLDAHPRRDASMHAIVGLVAVGGGGACFTDLGRRYIDVVNLLGGELAHICASNTWPTMLAESTLNYMPDPMVLREAPVPGTLQVDLTESTGTRTLSTDEWTYFPSVRELYLRAVRPEDGATVTVRYERALE